MYWNNTKYKDYTSAERRMGKKYEKWTKVLIMQEVNVIGLTMVENQQRLQDFGTNETAQNKLIDRSKRCKRRTSFFYQNTSIRQFLRRN